VKLERPSTERRVTVGDIVKAGLARPGDKWRLKAQGVETYAEITKEGTLLFGGQAFDSPSGAGKAATGGKSLDGWHYFSFRDTDGEWRPVDVLRERYGRAPAVSGSPVPWAAGSAAAMPPTVEQHLRGKPESRALVEALLQRAQKLVGNFRVHANSKHVVLTNRVAFAVISAGASSLRIGLRLDSAKVSEHPRLTVQPKGVFEGWSALHVSARVTRQDDIDDELLNLLRLAHQAAG